MDARAARRARRKAIVMADLAEAYSDEEAVPPEWVDIATEVAAAVEGLRAEVQRETARFASEPDVRTALKRRERTDANVRRRVDELNAKIRRLNLIAPHQRFTRPLVDAAAILRPLYVTRRRPGV